MNIDSFALVCVSRVRVFVILRRVLTILGLGPGFSQSVGVASAAAAAAPGEGAPRTRAQTNQPTN